jgi:hypothetical protein
LYKISEAKPQEITPGALFLAKTVQGRTMIDSDFEIIERNLNNRFSCCSSSVYGDLAKVISVDTIYKLHNGEPVTIYVCLSRHFYPCVFISDSRKTKDYLLDKKAKLELTTEENEYFSQRDVCVFNSFIVSLSPIHMSVDDLIAHIGDIISNITDCILYVINNRTKDTVDWIV